MSNKQRFLSFKMSNEFGNMPFIFLRYVVFRNRFYKEVQISFPILTLKFSTTKYPRFI
ncbi:hypothetical protein PGB90_006710 [Kerria lacca]